MFVGVRRMAYSLPAWFAIIVRATVFGLKMAILTDGFGVAVGKAARGGGLLALAQFSSAASYVCPQHFR